MTDPALAEAVRVLSTGTEHVVPDGGLAEKLALGRPLRVKLGVDPTSSDLHIGHAVVFRLLRRFQELGHTAVLIIGDFTAQVGDPSGRSATRPRLTKDEVERHAATYLDQAAKILLPDNLEIRRNSEWLASMGVEDVLGLMARTTVARMLERDDFKKRYESGTPISVMEFLYPLLQGWDSVAIESDVELGGTDQLFNCLMGRSLQEQMGQAPQVVMTVPLLEGLDGVRKMSKSYDNYVGIDEPASNQFGKLMKIADEMMPRYFTLTTGWHPDRIDEVNRSIADGSLKPVDAKRLLARTVVDLYHGEGAGAAAEGAFDQVFKEGARPESIDEVAIDAAEFVDGQVRLARVLALAFPAAVPSNKEGARKIAQGGVKLEGERIDDAEAVFDALALNGKVLQLGKRNWARVRA
ncbi:MAG: tyrosine--tRNA ligase [Acidimicrobiia bacterium]